MQHRYKAEQQNLGAACDFAQNGHKRFGSDKHYLNELFEMYWRPGNVF